MYYLESEDEIKIYLRYYQRYYNSVKKELKVDHACKNIKEVAMSIESNIQYFCCYKFIDVTIFDFLGDSIVEASNSGLKRGGVTISTNMNVDTLAFTQAQIGKTQARKNTSTYCVIDLEIMV